jgi:hypothetical protein
MKINNVLIPILSFTVLACVNLALPKGKEDRIALTDKPICEVIFTNSSINQTPFVLTRNPYKDTLWVFTTDLYKESSPRLVARRLIAFKDTITNIESYMGIEGSPMEMLTPVCPFDSIKFSTYFSNMDEIKHYNNNKVLYECEYFFKKGKNFEKYISRTYYNIDSNSYRIYNSQNDSTGIQFEDLMLKKLKIRNSAGCNR